MKEFIQDCKYFIIGIAVILGKFMKKHSKYIIAGSVLLIIAVGVSVFRAGNASRTFVAMDTKITITAKGRKAGKAVSQAVKMVQNYESKLSRTIESSDVYKINHGSVISNRFVEAHDLINISLSFSVKTLGVFDITAAPLVDLYADGKTPSEAEIANAKKLVDYKKALTAVATKEPMASGMQIDLGGIAKGYVADKIAEYFESQGVKKYCINLGGDVRVAEDRIYKIGIQAPSGQGVVGSVKVQGKSVATSGSYERGAHIVNPLTGKAPMGEVASATVIADDCTTADALSTVLYILGKDGVKQVEQLGGRCILIMENGETIVSRDVDWTAK